jgi:hypothetical protein
MLTQVLPVNILLALASFAVLSSCSLKLDWSSEGLPCDSEKQCAKGFSCLVNSCVAEDSLAAGVTCSATQQCEDNPKTNPNCTDCNICGSNPFTCRRRCVDNYFSNANCQTGEYCRPELERENTTVWTGACIASECATGSGPCRNPTTTSGACVAVSAMANSCQQKCAVSFTAPVTTENPVGFGDTCGGGQQYCQPIGPEDNQTLVCLKRLDNGATVPLNTGDLCELVKTPCGFGDACVGNSQTYCRKYCDYGANNLDGSHENDQCRQYVGDLFKYCCQVTNGSEPVYAVCMADCP